MTLNGNGVNAAVSLLRKVPTGVWAVIITQFVALVLWGIRLDHKTNENAEKIAYIAQNDTVPGQLLKQRVDLVEHATAAARSTIIRNFELEVAAIKMRIDRVVDVVDGMYGRITQQMPTSVYLEQELRERDVVIEKLQKRIEQLEKR
jgi:hypothetical protein